MDQRLPLIDMGALVSGGDRRALGEAIGQACRDRGFFYVVGHGIDEDLPHRLEALSRRFFALPLPDRMALSMARGGPAWRGYFPVGGELTSGRPDRKEGLYFGEELSPAHPLVAAGTPFHGANLFPPALPELRAAVLDYMAAMTGLGHLLMEGIALGLGLPASYFAERYTGEPLVLFRIFNYPPAMGPPGEEWGVGEHTDYGVLTMLWQDGAGGLEVKSGARWIEAPPLPGSFICNIGDMLDRMTGGRYRSTPHRVRNGAARDRLSFPFFFDPAFHAQVRPIELPAQLGIELVPDDAAERWDRASVHAFSGTYGDYLLEKVGRVFPALGQQLL